MGARHILHLLSTQPSVGLLENYLVVPISFYLEIQWRLVPGLSGPTAMAILVVTFEWAYSIVCTTRIRQGHIVEAG